MHRLAAGSRRARRARYGARSATARTSREIARRAAAVRAACASTTASGSTPTPSSSTATSPLWRTACSARESVGAVPPVPAAAPLAVGGHLVARGARPRLSAAAPQRLLLRRLRCGVRRRSSGDGRLPAEPTVYVCAQDRADVDVPTDAIGPSACCASSTRPPRRHRARSASGDRAMRRADLPPAGALRPDRRNARRGHGDDDAAGLRAAVSGDGRRALRPGVATAGWRRSSGRASRTPDPGAVPRGRQRASGAGRADGGAVGTAGGASRDGGPRFDRDGHARRLRLVVRRRPERRRPRTASRSSPSSAACSRPTTLGAAARRRRPAAPLRAQRRALRRARQALGDDRARPRRDTAHRRSLHRGPEHA